MNNFNVFIRFKILEVLPTVPRIGGSHTSTEEAKATTPEVGHVTIELCEMVGSNACSACAASTVSEFSDVIFDSYEIAVLQEQRYKKYSQVVMKCILSSQPVQVVKLGFNTNEIRPTEIVVYGYGKYVSFAVLEATT